MFVTFDRPLGKKSLISTPVASLGPSLVTVIVYVITSPIFGVASLTTFTKSKSINGIKPKSTVILLLSSSAVPFWSSSPVGSVPGINVITGEVITPSVNPSPSVSCCDPLSSPSTSSSLVLVGVDEEGKDAGGIICTI